MKQLTYLLIDFFSLLLPLAFTWNKRIGFYRQWKAVLAGLSAMWMVFIPWDILFTAAGVWGFNREYVTGRYLFNLPIEEYLFFLCIPYSCMFIYKALNTFFKDPSSSFTHVVTFIFLAVFLIQAVMGWGKLYTFYSGLSAFLFLTMLVFAGRVFLGRFYRIYFVSLLFFLVVNGILTGLPVVLYNNEQIAGIRLISIPAEDFVYSFLMLLIPVSVMEYFSKKKSPGQLTRASYFKPFL